MNTFYETHKGNYSFKKIVNALTSMLYQMLLPVGVLLFFAETHRTLLAILFLVGWFGTAFPFRESR